MSKSSSKAASRKPPTSPAATNVASEITSTQQHQPARWADDGALSTYLDITVMTVWRWEHDAKLNFPQASYINNRKRRDLNLVDDWVRARVKTAVVS